VAPAPGAAPFAAARGEEVGRFNMGSTVILLFPPGAIEWRAGLASGQTVRMGEPIGRRLDATTGAASGTDQTAPA
jgi:phosphatidylserine decarboxylase